jgi:hypothetical protein
MIRDGAAEKALVGAMNVLLNDTLIVRKDLAMIIRSTVEESLRQFVTVSPNLPSGSSA